MRVGKRAHHPRYSALIIRRTLQELTKSDGLIPRSHEWWGRTGAKWHGQEKLWVFPSGARLEFGYCEGPFDHLRYQGAAYIDILFEELTQWPDLTAYLYLFSRQRRPEGSELPLFMGSTFNPGGPGHEAVKDRFVTNRPEGTIFTPAKVADNPHLDIEEYRRSLSYLDPVTRAQLEEGDWDASPVGKYFRRDSFQFVNPESVPTGLKLCRGWDTGSVENGDATAGALLGVHGRDLYLLDMVCERAATPRVRDLVRETWRADPDYTLLAVEFASSGISVVQDIELDPDMGRVPLYPIRVNGDKEQRSSGWRARLGNKRMYLLRGGWNEAFIDECLRFTNEKTNRDDQIDAVSVAFAAIYKHFGDLDAEEAKYPEGSVGASLSRYEEDDE